MNIYSVVLDSVAASGADIKSENGNLFITGATRTIPLKTITNARRLFLGETPQVFTATVTAANSTKFSVSVAGRSTVSGLMRTFTATYTSAASGDTATTIALALRNILAAIPDANFTVSVSAGVITITAKSGDNTIVVSATSNIAVASTTKQAGSLSIASNGTVTGTSTTLSNFSVGDILIADDGASAPSVATFYKFYVTNVASDTSAAVYPTPASTLTLPNFYKASTLGSILSANYSYAAAAALTSTNRYAVYEITFNDSNIVGNGARPEPIKSKFIIFVNAGDGDVYGSSGFDATLAKWIYGGQTVSF